MTERAFLLELRRALMIALKAIELRLGVTPEAE
jgi:hypothetical protein